MKKTLLLFCALFLIGAGCNGSGDSLGSYSKLNDTFYGYMHWTHEDPGQNDLQWTVGFEADLVLEFVRDEENHWDVTGAVAGNPSTYECSTSDSSVACDLTFIRQGDIIGDASLDGEDLNLALTWDEMYPIEQGTVTIQGPLAPIVGEEELAVLNTDLTNEFLGPVWTLALPEYPYVDEGWGELSYGIPVDDWEFAEFIADVAAQTFATEHTLYGMGYGTFYLLAEDPNETVLKGGHEVLF